MSNEQRKSFARLHIDMVPMDVYCAICDASNELHKEFGGNRRFNQRDGLVRIVRGYQQMKKEKEEAVAQPATIQ